MRRKFLARVAMLFLWLLSPTPIVRAQSKEPPGGDVPGVLVGVGREEMPSFGSLLRGRVALIPEKVARRALPSPRVPRHTPAVPAPRLVKTARWYRHTLCPGEEIAYLAKRGGLAWESVALANGLLNPAVPTVGTQLLSPPSMWPARLAVAREGETPLTVAFRERMPLWRVRRANPLPTYKGAVLALPTAGRWAGELPEPLVSVRFAHERVVRGRTSFLMVETSEPATCRVTYLGQTVPCYTQDETHLVALIGLSALMEPGEYTLRVQVQGQKREVAFDLPITVEAGRYGFQRITPPQGLSGLMDPELMNGELAYLDHWRTLHTPERHWQFPLNFPLPIRISISAGYGDRRSYGGIVDGYHSGIDYRAWTGVRVLAPADGVVVMAERLQVRGNAVLIDHGWGVITGYWHLSRIDVEVGQFVHRGEAFARVGNTGLSTGSHLHWEVWVNGVPVDGRQWLDPDGMGMLHLPNPPLVPSRAGLLQ